MFKVMSALTSKKSPQISRKFCSKGKRRTEKGKQARTGGETNAPILVNNALCSERIGEGGQ